MQLRTLSALGVGAGFAIGSAAGAQLVLLPIYAVSGSYSWITFGICVAIGAAIGARVGWKL